MMYRHSRNLLLVFSFLAVLSIPAKGQLDTTLAYCNLFYATTDHPEVIPFEDNCFVNFNYEINDYPRVRVVGPMAKQVDFFREYDWSIQFYLPPMKDKGILNVAVPQNFLADTLNMPAGQIFLTLCDNRERRYYGPNSHKVDWIAVEGKVKINEYMAKQDGWKHPELQAQLDVYVQQLIQGEQGPKPGGPKVRFKCVLVVENKKAE